MEPLPFYESMQAKTWEKMHRKGLKVKQGTSTDRYSLFRRRGYLRSLVRYVNQVRARSMSCQRAASLRVFEATYRQ